MKKNLFILLLILLGVTGCSDWLDVKPRTEIKEQVMFNSENGFKTALNGVYIFLSEEALYAKNTSMYFPELLAQHWKTGDNVLGQISGYKYGNKDVETAIDKIWTKYYTTIANLNNVIYNVKNTSVRFFWKNDSIVRGEAVGLRGFLHFELLRLFGPVPSGADLEKPAIAYVEEMAKDPMQLRSISYKEVLEKIIRDLDEAEDYLKCDPLVEGSNYDFNNPGKVDVSFTPDDDWHYYRQRRFNYYAVKAAKARYYLWIDNKEQAAKYAKEVIEARNSDGSLKFRLSDASDYAGFYPNTIMQSEHLFGVINNSHQNIVQSLFKDANASLTQTQEKINIAYETGISPDDIRYKCWSLKEHDGTNTHHFQKYIGTDAIKPVNIVPLLRVSEMYLILMECLTPEAALEYFKVYRLARSLNSSLETVFTNDVRQRLESEYRKEFYGEGQMFFFYKRLHYTQFTWPQVIDVAPEVYALPIPKSQTAFE